SMGSVVGEKIARATAIAREMKLPLVIISGSGGGARMHEGMFSLMQMAKTSAAISSLREAGGIFISVLTDPTMGGVMASYASLGDVIIAEPGALIGFAGPRVIEQTIKKTLPEGFQTAEFLLEHGFLDMIVSRQYMRRELPRLIDFMVGPPKEPPKEAQTPPTITTEGEENSGNNQYETTEN
ncbi:MAG: acetyl-CoA carboxylase carboxyltransferase subunit beta, partial [Candidatus Brocadiales bacterium]